MQCRARIFMDWNYDIQSIIDEGLPIPDGANIIEHFCQRPAGHRGEHTDGNAGWPDEPVTIASWDDPDYNPEQEP